MIRAAFDRVAKRYFDRLLRKYLQLYVLEGDSVVEIDPPTTALAGLSDRYQSIVLGGLSGPDREAELGKITRAAPDFVVLNGVAHYEFDVQALFSEIRAAAPPSARLILVYYSALWQPAMRLATWFGLRDRSPEQNWVSHSDIANLCRLSDFEIVRHDYRVLLPVRLPLLADWVNAYLAPLPVFRWFALANIVVARAVPTAMVSARPSVSVVVPARNEAGNIENLISRLPPMGPDDELIFIEGHSKDETWQTILDLQARCDGKMNILADQQDGKGKGDAVRKGFALATRDILMILDADLSVPPEELPKFYQAIVSGKGEFINGSRLVYPMEQNAMRFLNVIGNKFFATAFSFVVGQQFKDTLCGTKVISRENYEKLAAHRSYFGDFDPFGDFDLIFGAARLGLSIVEIPIHYRERTYGATNIDRWRHGALLMRMTLLAARKFKFI